MSIRPVFRVAVAGLDDRDVRLIEIVFKHSQYNRFDFQLLSQPDPACTDVLIVNPATPSGLDALTALRSQSRRVPSISAVPRGVQSAAHYAITIDRLTLQLLPTLKRVVEAEGLETGAGVVAPDSSGPVHPPSSGAAAGDEIPLVATRIELDSPAGAGMAVAEASRAAVAPGRAELLADLDLDALFADAAGPVPPTSVRRPDGTAMAATGVALRPGASAAVPMVRPRSSGGLAEPPALSPAAMVPSAAAGRWLPAAPDPLAVEIAAPPIHRPDVLNVQVLIADPSVAAQQQLARALRSPHLEVRCVTSASAALDATAARQFDLLITEQDLSDAGGFRLIAALRQRPGYRTTPILLLRSRAGLFDVARARLHGDVLLLTKPLTRSELQVVVADVLRRSMALDELDSLFEDGAR